MTSDAKIGLLLGLIFIFMIAFIINGLGDFRASSNNNELTTQMIDSQKNYQALAAKERKVREVFNQPEPVNKADVAVRNSSSSDDTEQNIRFSAPLPKNSPVAKNDVIINPAPAKSTVIRAKTTLTVKARSKWPKYHLVGEDDNLAFIAKRFYGAKQGNKKENIDRIFKANQQLKNPDEIYIGQKLVIPALANSSNKKKGVTNASAGTRFQKGRVDQSRNSRDVRKNSVYVVRQDDSLWEIAARKLGNGCRYSEIAELNRDILADEDNLVVGMRLKMPAR
ncbi:MAG: LysM peptidoglycan-binding domain-containing protein [Planctomycetota bacterium]|jgi:nucleoid-associated protein YgaU